MCNLFGMNVYGTIQIIHYSLLIKESRILAPIHQASWLVPQCT